MVGVSINNSNKADDKERLVEANSGNVIVTVLPLKGQQEEVLAPQTGDVRRRKAPILFGCLSAFFMLGCLAIGTWLLFDFINRTNHTWHRTCRFRIKPMYQDPDNRIFFDHGGLTAFDDGKNQLLGPSSSNIQREFQQDVNVDVKKNVETIEVPQIDFTSTVRIIEDFNHNITVIRDYGVNKCFIMPLDRQQIPEPTDIIKTFLAMMSGQFLPDNEVLRRTMKVQKSALSKAEVAMYGPMVIDTCPEYIKTYRLVQKTAEEMKQRHRRSSDALAFMYSVGQRALMFDIDY